MGSLWGKECVQDDSATVIVPVFEWVKCFDVINRTMQQSWRGESVQSHVITQADISHFNTLRPRQNGHHFPDDNLKCTFLNENICISIEISLKFVPTGPINNIPSLVQIMAWRRPGDKPLSESVMDYLLTHICVTRPQWVNENPLHKNHSLKIQ